MNVHEGTLTDVVIILLLEEFAIQIKICYGSHRMLRPPQNIWSCDSFPNCLFGNTSSKTQHDRLPHKKADPQGSGRQNYRQ